MKVSKRVLVLAGVFCLTIVLVAAAALFVDRSSNRGPHLPGVPNGWTRLTSGTYSTGGSLGSLALDGTQMRFCWVVQGSQVQQLNYAIGNPGGSTTLYTKGDKKTGCIFDPGNDTGTENVHIGELGIGNYMISVDQQNIVNNVP